MDETEASFARVDRFAILNMSRHSIGSAISLSRCHFENWHGLPDCVPARACAGAVNNRLGLMRVLRTLADTPRHWFAAYPDLRLEIVTLLGLVR